MSCDCHTIGGPFIGADPNCEAHGHAAAEEREAMELRISELEAEALQLRDRLEQAIAVACSASNDAERALREADLL